MEKAGLKTFVYSFVFSLFAIFGANSAYLRTLTPKNPEIKISNKNITLFLRNGTSAETGAVPAPAKKIVLSIIPDIPEPVRSDSVPEADRIPLTAGETTGGKGAGQAEKQRL